MKTLLILGGESLAGAVLLERFSRTHTVLELSTDHSSQRDAEVFIASKQVDAIIYCGQASLSAWDSADRRSAFCSDSQSVAVWTMSARRSQIPFIFISSDAVFDGPWIYHAEDCESFSQTPRAQSILSQEGIVSDYESAWIVRTQLIGFSPDSLLTQVVLDGKSVAMRSAIEHATPLYAGDFAVKLAELLPYRLSGITHLGGGERISRSQFLADLAGRFGCPTLARMSTEDQVPIRETSLRSSQAKSLLSNGLSSMKQFWEFVAADVDSGLAAKLAGRKTFVSRVA